MTSEYPEYPDRIWFDPPKFWAATRNMTKAEADWLGEKIYELAEKHDIETLRQFSFIYVGNPYRRKTTKSD
jgi:hypothetical protein